MILVQQKEEHVHQALYIVSPWNCVRPALIQRSKKNIAWKVTALYFCNMRAIWVLVLVWEPKINQINLILFWAMRCQHVLELYIAVYESKSVKRLNAIKQLNNHLVVSCRAKVLNWLYFLKLPNIGSHLFYQKLCTFCIFTTWVESREKATRWNTVLDCL